MLTALRFKLRVMSGIITGPHFIKFFNAPNALELGSMVAVLEVGAFSACVRWSFVVNLIWRYVS